jgi:5-formyltetrahydrofolate cyclo-ligase
LARSPAGEKSSVAQAKADLRARVLAARDALDGQFRANAAAAILSTLLQLEELTRAGSVLAYSSFGTELDTHGFLDRVIESGRQLVLPRVDRAERRLRLYAVADLDRDLASGTWGIREPDPDRCREVTLADVDFVLVPGVAFDTRGGRLGYGGGFYDRLLATAEPSLPRVAAAFAVQVVDAVPVEGHDRTMTTLVTERGTIAIR